MNEDTPLQVLFVCMGNLCRSPMAEAVLRAQAHAAGLEGRIEVDSAGTHGYHLGLPADERAVEVARARGYDLAGIRARQVERADFERFDHVIAMDPANLRLLESLAGRRARVSPRLLLDHVVDPPRRDVPDPYYGAINAFEQALDLIETGCGALLDEIRRTRGW